MTRDEHLAEIARLKAAADEAVKDYCRAVDALYPVGTSVTVNEVWGVIHSVVCGPASTAVPEATVRMGRSGLVTDVRVSDVRPAPDLHAAARDALALLGTLSAADCLGDRHAAAAEATGKKLYAALTAAEARPCAST